MTRRLMIRSRIPAQLEFWASPARYKAYVGGLGAGKTFAGAAELLALPAGTPAIVVAPTYPMLRDTTAETVLELARSFGLVRRFHETRLVLDLVDGKRILFRSGEKPDHLRGPNLGAAWIDEAAYCRPKVWGVVMGRVRLLPGRIWVTTTPRGRNWVHERWIKRATPQHCLIRSSSRANPYLRPDYVADLEADYNAHWRHQEIEGEFVEESTTLLIPPEWWERCATARHLPDGFVRIACDLAKGAGGDRAVVLVRDDGGVLDLQWSREWDKAKVAEVVAELKHRYRVADHRISYDAGGIGDDFQDYLSARGVYGSRPYRGNGTPPNRPGDGRSINLRSFAACLGLAPRLDPTLPDLARRPVDGVYPTQAAFAVRPDWVELLREEIQELRYTLDAGGSRRLETKQDYQDRLGHSPDFADTLIQSFAFTD